MRARSLSAAEGPAGAGGSVAPGPSPLLQHRTSRSGGAPTNASMMASRRTQARLECLVDRAYITPGRAAVVTPLSLISLAAPCFCVGVHGAEAAGQVGSQVCEEGCSSRRRARQGQGVQAAQGCDAGARGWRPRGAAWRRGGCAARRGGYAYARTMRPLGDDQRLPPPRRLPLTRAVPGRLAYDNSKESKESKADSKARPRRARASPSRRLVTDAAPFRDNAGDLAPHQPAQRGDVRSQGDAVRRRPVPGARRPSRRAAASSARSASPRPRSARPPRPARPSRRR